MNPNIFSWKILKKIVNLIYLISHVSLAWRTVILRSFFTNETSEKISKSVIQVKNYSVELIWFIWFHKFLWPGLFKFSVLLWDKLCDFPKLHFFSDFIPLCSIRRRPWLLAFCMVKMEHLCIGLILLSYQNCNSMDVLL